MMFLIIFPVKCKIYSFILFAIWVLVKVRANRAEVMYQTPSERKLFNFFTSHLKNSDEIIKESKVENDEFGPGVSVITKDERGEKNFYTTGNTDNF